MPQFLMLGIGHWWLFIAIGVFMFFLYKKPELYGRKGLMTAIISVQIANLIGGVSFYFLVDYRSVIVLIIGAFCLIFPLRTMLMIGLEINAERKQRECRETGIQS